MYIKSANLSDSSTLSHIGIKTWQETFTGIGHYTSDLVSDYTETAFSGEKIDAELRDRNSWFYLLSDKENGEPAGYMKLKLGGEPECVKGERIVGLERLYFLKRWQGQGLGRQAFKFALRQAEGWGYPKIWLSVWEHNQPARGFYEKMGCQKCGSWDWAFMSQGRRIVDLDYIMICHTGL